MAADFSSELKEWCQWYSEHLNDGAGIDQQIRFLKKSLIGVLRLLTLADIEIRRSQGKHSESLWLPTELRAQGDMSRFG